MRGWSRDNGLAGALPAARGPAAAHGPGCTTPRATRLWTETMLGLPRPGSASSLTALGDASPLVVPIRVVGFVVVLLLVAMVRSSVSCMEC